MQSPENVNENETTQSEPESLQKEAQRTIQRYMIGAMASGLILLPGADALAVIGVQLKMLHSLCGIYNIPFSEKRGRSIICALAGGLGTSALARGTFGSLIKFIPVIGPVVGSVTMPVLAGGTTYAIGSVFVRHFERGGSISDFNEERVKDDFINLYREGEAISKEMKANEPTED